MKTLLLKKIRNETGSGPCQQQRGICSIQSVNNPGYYLRHRNYDFRLDKNDGLQFLQRMQPLNWFRDLQTLPVFLSVVQLSDRYIRHYGFLLKLEKISTDLDRKDATFIIISDDTPEL